MLIIMNHFSLIPYLVDAEKGKIKTELGREKD